jgi:glycosyltransferase involved in cell wall biosynthesis
MTLLIANTDTRMNYGLCYVCDEYPPVVDAFGGMGVAFREQAEAFARRGRRVEVICRTADRPPGIHVIHDVRVHVVRPGAIPKVRAFTDRLRLASLVRRICTKPADLVICPDYAGPLLVKSFRNPLIVRLGGAMSVTTPSPAIEVNRTARFFERRTVDLADATWAVSRFGADVTIATLGARPRPVQVFPNAVDPVRFHPAPAEVDPNRVLFVGKLNYLKGIFVLADAIHRVFARLPSATLSLIGGDLVEGGQSCQARFLDLLDAEERARVRVLGRLSHADAAREMRQCGVMVLPSYTDICPNAVLEAMSCGRPVVASDRGGIPELVQNGRTGLLADPDRPATFSEALIRLLTDRQTAEDMGVAGRRAVLAAHTREALVDRLQRFFDEVSGASHPRPH